MRIDRWILAVLSQLVPKDVRDDWRAEWQAELDHRDAVARIWHSAKRSRLALVHQSTGAFWDALWLQSSRWHSFRLAMRHWPLVTAAFASLTVAIAAVAIGLSAYNALLLRPPGVRDPDTLRFIHVRTAAEPFGSASFPEFMTYRDQAHTFADIAAWPYAISSVSFTGAGVTDRVVATEVSANFFSVVGAPSRAGVLAVRDASSDGGASVVISEALWRKLGATTGVVGTTVQLNDQPVAIAGVVPRSLRGMTWGFEPDVWMSLKTAEVVLGNSPSQLTDRSERWLHMIGRLAPGVSASQAAAEVTGISAVIERDHPDTNTAHTAALSAVTVTPPGDRSWATAILGSLIGVVLLTLVVACANVTNLLLGLAAARRHEMLVRAALGASRLQLFLPLMRESALLGLVSGLAGYGVAWIALTWLAGFKPSLGSLFPSVSLDLRPDGLVLATTAGLALLAGVAVGLIPALRGASEGLSGSIARSVSTADPRRGRIRHALVVMQMAIATIVLAGVGISIHSLVNLQHAPLGFANRNLVFGFVDLGRSGYTARTGPAEYDRLRDRLTTTPGIEAVALASDAPVSGSATDHVVADSDPPPADGHGAETPYGVVDSHYFDTIGMRVLAGRSFDSRDQEGGAEVVVVNEMLARLHWHGESPIGRHLRIDNGHRLVEVIGVVPDSKYNDVDEPPRPSMYYALAQHYQPDVTVIVRTDAPRDVITRALRGADANIVPNGMTLMTLDELLGISMLLPRVIVWTTIVFGVVALALAAFGLYSTVFYSVSQRRVEIGIRTALGATRRHIFRLVMRQSGWVALAGALAGLAAGAALLPIVASIFYGIGDIDPLVFAAVAMVSAAIALSTTYLVVRPWTRAAVWELLKRS